MSNARRVLHVVPYFEGADAYGGIPRVAAGLTRALVDRGHEITVCTTDARDARRRHPGSGHVLLSHAGVRTLVFRNLHNRLAFDQVFLAPGAWLWLTRHVQDFDLLHLHGHRHLCNEVAASAARAAGVPYVLHANGTLPRIERRQRLKVIYDRLVADATVHGCARALAVSAAEEAQYCAAGLDNGRIALLPNGVDLAEFEGLANRGEAATARRGWRSDGNGRHTLRERLGIDGAPLVAFLGKATPRKEVATLVDALDRDGLHSAHLVVAGSDMGGLAAARSRARALRIEGRVHFIGPLEGRARLQPLHEADVVAYPGQDEIFGLVAFEALLCGTPVVVADDSGCGEWIGGQGLGETVPPGDPGALADRLARVLRDRRSAAAQVRRGQRWIRENLTWSRLAAELEQVYEGMLESLVVGR